MSCGTFRLDTGVLKEPQKACSCEKDGSWFMCGKTEGLSNWWTLKKENQKRQNNKKAKILETYNMYMQGIDVADHFIITPDAEKV